MQCDLVFAHAQTMRCDAIHVLFSHRRCDAIRFIFAVDLADAMRCDSSWGIRRCDEKRFNLQFKLVLANKIPCIIQASSSNSYCLIQFLLAGLLRPCSSSQFFKFLLLNRFLATCETMRCDAIKSPNMTMRCDTIKTYCLGITHPRGPTTRDGTTLSFVGSLTRSWLNLVVKRISIPQL